MTPTLTWDSSKFTDAMRELAQISGRDFATVCKRELASAVRIVAGQVKIRSVKKVSDGVRKRYMASFSSAPGKISTTKRTTWFRFEQGEWVPAGSQSLPRVTVKTGPQAGKKLTGTASKGWRLQGATWYAEQQAERLRERFIPREIERRLPARYLKMQSWVQVADSLGIDLNSVPPSTKAIPMQEARDASDRKGRTYRNGSATERAAGADYAVTLTNESGPEIASNGQARLNAALNRRAAAFENNLKHGVFQDVKTRMARYPGIFVTGDTPPANE